MNKDIDFSLNKDNYFDPKTDKFPYPIDTDKHYLVVKKDDGTKFDGNYPYVDKSKKFLRKKWWIFLLIRLIVSPLVYIRLGLKIKGRKNLKKHKEEISKGVISAANHVHMWDYLCILTAIRPIKSYILSWDKNISGENGFLIRMVGGIPIPDSSDFLATLKFTKAIRDVLNGGWLHLYPEGSMWEYYAPIRPFKRGSAAFAIQFDKPIIPMGFSYRKPSWIRRKIFGQIALYTLSIGEPIYANKELARNEQEEDLISRVHEEICRLANIDPKKNIYPKIFDNSKRIDYYTSSYGKNYKGSH